METTMTPRDDPYDTLGDPLETHDKRTYFKVMLGAAFALLICFVVAIALYSIFYLRAIDGASAAQLQRPRRLVPGVSSVGLISPASPFSAKVPNATEYLARVERELTGPAFNFSRVLRAPHMGDVWGFFAGTDSNRSADVNQFFANSTAAPSALVANRGGYGCMRLLDMLDYAAIGGSGKALVGYSDLTALLNAIVFHTGLVTFHGPMGIDSLAPDTLNAQYMARILFANELILYRNPPARPIKTLNSGKAKGRLVGGNLSVFVSLLGSKFLPPNSRLRIRWEDVILFFEDVSESSQSVDRMFSSLAVNGILDRVAGVVWGTCYSCSQSVPLEDILKQHLKMPAFMNASIGHDGDQWTIPLGVLAEMDADAGTIQLLEPAMSDS